jgi:hypothetical protein
MMKTNTGQTVIGIIIGVGAGLSTVFGIWDSGLSVQVFNDHATISSLTASVSDIKKSTKDLQTTEAEVNWLAELKGYNGSDATTTSF